MSSPLGSMNSSRCLLLVFFLVVDNTLATGKVTVSSGGLLVSHPFLTSNWSSSLSAGVMKLQNNLEGSERTGLDGFVSVIVGKYIAKQLRSAKLSNFHAYQVYSAILIATSQFSAKIQATSSLPVNDSEETRFSSTCAQVISTQCSAGNTNLNHQVDKLA